MQIPEVIKKLSIDLETYSSVPIKYGVYPYAESSRVAGIAKSYLASSRLYSARFLQVALILQKVQ